MRFQGRVFAVLFCIALACDPQDLHAQHPANSNLVYQQLRNLLPGDYAVTVNNAELRRDAAIFTFRRGDFAFFTAVNGKITGAVFKGEGHFHLTPPTAEERHNLAILLRSDTNPIPNGDFDEDFNEVVLRFTDDTAAELKGMAGGTASVDSEFAEVARRFHAFQREKLKENLDLRLLQDVLSPTQGGYFLAAIHGKKDSHLIFRLDPHGATDVAPEEVSLLNWGEWGPIYLTAFHLNAGAAQNVHTGHEENTAYRVDHEDLDTSIEKNGFLNGLAIVHVIALQDGLAVVPLALYPTLRVSQAETDKGNPLDFVQEKKDEDADLGVVLPAPLNKGEVIAVRITYAGKDVVMNEGGANYYPIARESWYPNAGKNFGDYATFRMTFHVPKGLQLVATGTKLNESSEAKVTTSEWKSDDPLPVVGFNLGDFKMEEATLTDTSGKSLTIDAFANTHSSDLMNRIGEWFRPDPLTPMKPAALGAVGTLDTTSMLSEQLRQGQVAARIYTNYFGPLPFAKISLTQQFACDYGQSWPTLVYLPICGFLDSTQQYSLGLRPENMYWKVVTPHEVAHQWWGDSIGFRSYRDEWMSEGFAHTSASIFLQLTQPKPDEFREFWKQQRHLITEKNADGFRPIDVGPVTMGFRLSTYKTGWNVYLNLVYPKGAFILHMIRMMMWSPKDGDARFIATMRDFVETFKLRAATTEDFKAVVEKHMSPQMDLDGNHKLDWFFNEYVYGTALPSYHWDAQVTPNGEAQSLRFNLKQSGVTQDFKIQVPIYLEFEDGKVQRLGSATIVGNSSIDKTLALPKFPSPVKKASINYYYDVLSLDN